MMPCPSKTFGNKNTAYREMLGEKKRDMSIIKLVRLTLIYPDFSPSTGVPIP